MGVWIEIKVIKFLKTLENVTPFVGVWIEISAPQTFNVWVDVTPFVGVWIEIFSHCFMHYPMTRHSLRGSVD